MSFNRIILKITCPLHDLHMVSALSWPPQKSNAHVSCRDNCGIATLQLFARNVGFLLRVFL